jgi:hypothetical protein
MIAETILLWPLQERNVRGGEELPGGRVSLSQRLQAHKKGQAESVHQEREFGVQKPPLVWPATDVQRNQIDSATMRCRRGGSMRAFVHEGRCVGGSEVLLSRGISIDWHSVLG